MSYLPDKEKLIPSDEKDKEPYVEEKVVKITSPPPLVVPEFEVRRAALESATRHVAGNGLVIPTGSVIAAAKEYEKYLRGQDDRTD